MKIQANLGVWDESPVLRMESGKAGSRSIWKIYVEISKLKLTALAAFSAIAAFIVASRGDVNWAILGWTFLGIFMSSAGSSGINQWIEKDLDGRMNRTCGRPLPTGRISSDHVLAWSIAMAVGGVSLLAWRVNLLTAFLSFLCVAVYVGLYTPMKRINSLNTLVGAICGALLPMGGWAAAIGRLEYGAWILAAILFIWQIPHFLALGCLYRDDYTRGGFQMLPSVDQSGDKTCKILLMYSFALIPVTLLMTFVGLAGWIYFAGALAMGLVYLYMGFQLEKKRTAGAARSLFLASIFYLQLVLTLLLFDPTSIL